MCFAPLQGESFSREELRNWAKALVGGSFESNVLYLYADIKTFVCSQPDY